MGDPESWRHEYLNGDHPLPPEVDITVPSVARVYDYALGGKQYFEVDRRAYADLELRFPGIGQLAKDNRAFLQRAVRYLVGEAGIRQLIDVGSGLPTAGNVHEIAHAIAPATRVVYVDKDPIVLAHGRALLDNNHTTTVIQADAADPASILDSEVTREFIDVEDPFAVLMVGLLHWMPDEQDPAGVTRVFKDAMPAGSYLAATVLLDDDPIASEIQRQLTEKLGVGWLRPWEEHLRYFRGLSMVPPGHVYANDWRPTDTPDESRWHTFLTGGIGRKPS
jgi:hypothetical protein